MQNEENHVVFDNVTKHYASNPALLNFSLSIAKGEFITIIGPSGSGKTTTLRCLTGLESLTSGAIYVSGDRINHVPPHKRDMAMVWQEYVLFPHMSVGENIEFGLKMRGINKDIRRKMVLESLKVVGLEVPVERSVDQLSGGERQRVGLARGLVTKPQVLLLDEPLASLDRNLRVTMQGELKSIHKELGITFLYVTHNQSEALAMANRIVVMNNGSIEQVGTPKELFEMPKTRFIAEFVGENNVFEGVTISSNKSGMVRLSSRDREFTVVAEKEIPPKGKSVVLIVRSDLILMYSETEKMEKSFDNVLPAHILGEEYFGTIVKYTLRSEEGQTLEVTKPVGYYRGGEEVILGWNAGDGHLLPWDTS